MNFFKFKKEVREPSFDIKNDFAHAEEEIVQVKEEVKEEVKHYTAEDVTKEMTAMMLVFLNEMQKYIEYKQLPQELAKEKIRLKALGLKNCKNAQIIGKHEDAVNQYNKNVDCFRLMTEAWQIFGKDVIIVRYDQFFQLLEKYNLVCGTLDRYTGFIPENNLAEMERIMSMDIPRKFAEPLKKRNSSDFDLEVETIIKSIRFPFYPNFANSINVLEENGIPFIWNDFESILPVFNADEYLPKFFIAAPVNEMKKTNIFFRNNYSFGEKGERVERKKKELNDLCTFVETKDPFFCSCTEHGVLIYSKWGDEAQDDIIKRYEELSKTINI